MAAAGDGPSRLSAMATKATSAQVLEALRRHYGLHRDGRLTAPEWAALAEFSVDLGVERPRCDLFVVRAWSGRPKGHERHAIEIKVSRTDLRNELAAPTKRQAFAGLANRFWFATPAGLVRDGGLPDDCGLLEMTASGRIRVAAKAPRTDAEPMPERGFVEAFRRASRAEARIAGADDQDAAARAVQLAKDLERAENRAISAQAAANREKARTERLIELVLSSLDEVPCTCGTTLVRHRGRPFGIRHIDPAADERCPYPYPDRRALDGLLHLPDDNDAAA